MNSRLILLAMVVVLFATVQAQRQDQKWPYTFSSPAGSITIYEPQVDSFDQTVLTAHAAVSITPPGKSEPVFGALWLRANVATNRDTRTVRLTDVSVTDSRFPGADQSQVAAISHAVSQNTAGLTLSLDGVLASLSETQKQESAEANLNNSPPQIIYSDSPSVLVTIDGPPRLSAAPNSNLMRVVNTPFFIVLDPSTKTYYLRGPSQWLSAADIKGPWETAQGVPDAVTALASTEPASSGAAAGDQVAMQSQAVPKIIVTTQPAELIQTDGQPQFGTIAGTNLLYVTNSDSDLFMEIDSQELYVLLSGRWYSARTKEGPWSFVAPNQLPADFAKIPPGSPKAGVLANVAGTQAARNSVLDASVPQTAAIKRDAPGPDVKYDGAPKFAPIEKNPLQYATNTPHSVIKDDSKYYCCSDGVWFVGDDPEGSWQVAESVPEVIYTIPPTCPIYTVTYCRIYSFTPDVVYCGYLPGYVGSYVWQGTVVYGTGWPYTPWYGSVYIPRPLTWGFGAVFNPVSCVWGFGVGYGWGATFGFAHHGNTWWGPGGWRPNYWSNKTVIINRNVTKNYFINNNIYYRHSERLTEYSKNEYNVASEKHADEIRKSGEKPYYDDNQRRDEDQKRLDDEKRYDEHESADEQKRLEDQKRDDATRYDDQERADEQKRLDDEKRDEEQKRDEEARENAERRDDHVDHPHNDVYAGSDGNVYKHSIDGWQRNSSDGWKSVREDPEHENFQQHVQPQLSRDFSARGHGADHAGHEDHGGERHH